MTHIYYGAGHDDTKSQAELDLLERFEKLPDDFTVIHSAPWITHPSKDGTVGEADFIIAHPQHGVLIAEVKGGVIHTKRDGKRTLWWSGPHEIHDPCQQADRSRWRLKDWLDNDRRTKRLSFALFPMVILPDCHVDADIRPDCTKDIILDMTDVDALERSLLNVYAFWNERYRDNPIVRMGGQPSVDALVELLVPESNLSPRIAMIFERERREIERLTEQQFRVLRQLRKFHRAAIVGGAGTGKTMLAMEKAHQLAQAGMRVLFLCFNRPLADWIETNVDDEDIVITTFHGLTGMAVNWAGLSGMRQGDFYDKAADYLLDAALIMQAPDFEDKDRLFDAIVVDEAQDFEDEWWIPLPDLLKDKESGIFYVFFDDNQRIYTQISNVPMQEHPFYLDENCRTTQAIHEKMLPYSETDEDVYCFGPEGRPVEHIPAEDEDEAKDALRKVLHRLIHEENVDPTQIVILTPTRKKSIWEDGERLGNLTLTWDTDTDMEGVVNVTTIYLYKGLESAVVILTELDKAREELRDQLIYVGLSRARNHAIVIGEFPEPVKAQAEE